MKEKRKGHPRRRIFLLISLLVFLLGGYFSLPFAQTAFVAWWEDDPFTPLCDVPNLRLRMALVLCDCESGEEGFPFYDVASGQSFVVAEGLAGGDGGTVSPNGRWIVNLGYTAYERASFLYDIETNTQIEVFYSPHYTQWLLDSRLVVSYLRDNGEVEWFLYNPEDQSQLEFSRPQMIFPNRYLVNDAYFLGVERIEGQGLELSLYEQNLERKVLQQIPIEESWYWESSGSLSPDGRYFVYQVPAAYPAYAGVWMIDLSEEAPEPVHISNESLALRNWSSDSTYFIYTRRIEGELNFGIEIFDTEAKSHVLSYEIPGEDIISLEWAENGIWLWTQNSSEENPDYVGAADAVYWGHFDGINLSMEKVMEASFGYPIYPLRDSDLLIAMPLESPEDQLVYESMSAGAYSRLWNHFVLINPEGEILQRVENVAWDFIRQTPDNRYLSYQGKNRWIYLLDLETFDSCRVIEGEDEYETYEWLSIPQS